MGQRVLGKNGVPAPEKRGGAEMFGCMGGDNGYTSVAKKELKSACILLKLVLSYTLHYYGSLDFKLENQRLKALKMLSFRQVF